MKIHAQVLVDVTVHNLDQLRTFALKRAIEAGMTEGEFDALKTDAGEGDIPYFLGWAFDAGTPDMCGFQIESSRVEEFGA